MQTRTQWNLIRRSMTAPLPVLSPSSILPSPAAHCACMPVRKNYAHVSKMLFHFYFLFA